MRQKTQNRWCLDTMRETRIFFGGFPGILPTAEAEKYVFYSKINKQPPSPTVC